MIPGSANALLLGSAAGGYTISRSIRLNASDSAYLSRTPASAGNRKTWTWAGWVKRSAFTLATGLFSTGSSATNISTIYFNVDGTLWYYDYIGGVFTTLIKTLAVYRDLAAWQHIVVSVDTTQGSSSNRVKLYINGSQVTQFSAATYPSLNADTLFNTANVHYINREYSTSNYGDHYLADIHFIDGQALDPTSFGEFSATTGVWMPKRYAGTYGTNGFKLDFSDNSAATATTLGKDSSGNGNNFTPNNLSVTAGAGNDSLIDVPVNGTQPDTGAGGEVRGNYCTLNSLTANSVFTLSNGNLDVSDAGSNAPVVLGSIAVNSGKWYWEVTLGSSTAYVGAAKTTSRASVDYLGATTGQFMYNPGAISSSYVNGNLYNYSTASGATTGDVIGIALNFDLDVITFYKNGTSLGAFSSSLLGTDTWAPAFKSNNFTSATFNFGQRPFAYTAPSGFKALCTANLPAPTIVKPSTVMDVKTYTGNGSTQTVSGLEFSPDLVWIKSRSAATNNALYDTVRGAYIRLESNTTAAEVNSADGLGPFNSDGFTLNGSSLTNTNAATYAAWTWDAGSSTVTNAAGTISSQVRANASAGFSIVTWTASANNSTIGHGLGVAPSLIITKSRTVSGANWETYHRSLGREAYIRLDSTAAVATYPDYWGTSGPSSTVFQVSLNGNYNNTGNMLAYCFAPVAGYSAFGSYTGNGSADGPFVYLGFRPALVIVKMSSSTGNWTMLDYQREGYNVDNDPLYPNLSNAEGTTDLIDITSNGFKVRTTDATFNTNTGTYVYAAWAQSPFSLARAR